MGLTAKAALAGLIAFGLCLTGQQTLGLLAGGVFVAFAVPWYYRLFRGALGFGDEID